MSAIQLFPGRSTQELHAMDRFISEQVDSGNDEPWMVKLMGKARRAILYREYVAVEGEASVILSEEMRPLSPRR